MWAARKILLILYMLELSSWEQELSSKKLSFEEHNFLNTLYFAVFVVFVCIGTGLDLDWVWAELISVCCTSTILTTLLSRCCWMEVNTVNFSALSKLRNCRPSVGKIRANPVSSSMALGILTSETDFPTLQVPGGKLAMLDVCRYNLSDGTSIDKWVAVGYNLEWKINNLVLQN